MNNIYMIALAVATTLNILYTVYSYNDLNKWRQAHTSQYSEFDSKLVAVDAKTKFNSTLIESNSETIDNVAKRADDRITSTATQTEQADSKIVSTMMSLETRLYTVEEEVFKTKQELE